MIMGQEVAPMCQVSVKGAVFPWGQFTCALVFEGRCFRSMLFLMACSNEPGLMTKQSISIQCDNWDTRNENLLCCFYISLVFFACVFVLLLGEATIYIREDSAHEFASSDQVLRAEVTCRVIRSYFTSRGSRWHLHWGRCFAFSLEGLLFLCSTCPRLDYTSPSLILPHLLRSQKA